MRKLCTRCCADLTEDHDDYKATKRWLGGDVTGVKVAVGCTGCDNSGFMGRIALSEVFLPSSATRPQIRRAAHSDMDDGRGPKVMSLEEAALADGFEDLGEDAARKVRTGMTTLIEVLRVHTPAKLVGESELAGEDDERGGAEERSSGVAA